MLLLPWLFKTSKEHIYSKDGSFPHNSSFSRPLVFMYLNTKTYLIPKIYFNFSVVTYDLAVINGKPFD